MARTACSSLAGMPAMACVSKGSMQHSSCLLSQQRVTWAALQGLRIMMAWQHKYRHYQALVKGSVGRLGSISSGPKHRLKKECTGLLTRLLTHLLTFAPEALRSGAIVRRYPMDQLCLGVRGSASGLTLGWHACQVPRCMTLGSPDLPIMTAAHDVEMRC